LCLWQLARDWWASCYRHSAAFAALAAATAPSVASYFLAAIQPLARTWNNVGYRDRGAALRLDVLFRIADQLDDQEFKMQAHHAAWATTVWEGDLLATRLHVNQALAIHDREKPREHAIIYGGHDPAVCGYGQGGLALWLLGYPDHAEQSVNESLGLAESLAHIPSIGHALWFAAIADHLRDDFELVLRLSDRLQSVGGEHGLTFYKAVGDTMHGALAGLGQAGLHALREGIGTFLAVKAELMLSLYYSILAGTELHAGNLPLCSELLDKAEKIPCDRHSSYWRAGILNLRGDLLASTNSFMEAERCYLDALDVARQQ
jgi:predicted ATPase